MANGENSISAWRKHQRRNGVSNGVSAASGASSALGMLKSRSPAVAARAAAYRRAHQRTPRSARWRWLQHGIWRDIMAASDSIARR
jgi:hypothetical protein